jgi:hypothetical protein
VGQSASSMPDEFLRLCCGTLEAHKAQRNLFVWDCWPVQIRKAA